MPTPFVHINAPHKAPEVSDLSDEELGKLEPWPLYLRYLEEQMAFGRVALEVQRRREQKRLHVPAEEAPIMEWGPGRHHIISPELGFDIYSFQLFMENVPAHTENGAPQTSGDAVRYYIGGEGVEVIGEETVRVRAGDFTCIPAGARHETTNPHDEDLRFISWQQIPGTYVQVHMPVLPAE